MQKPREAGKTASNEPYEALNPRSVQEQAERFDSGLSRRSVSFSSMAERSSKTHEEEKDTEAVEETVVEEVPVDEPKEELVRVKLSKDYEGEDDEVRIAVAGLSPADDFTDDDGRVVVSKRATKVPKPVAFLLEETQIVQIEEDKD